MLSRLAQHLKKRAYMYIELVNRNKLCYDDGVIVNLPGLIRVMMEIAPQGVVFVSIKH
jgi:hypothetical protein